VPTGHKWRPIKDLEHDPKTLTDGELGPLSRIWERQKAELIEQRTLSEFERRLKREWSIETGIIENVYTLDRGVTQTLIEKGIDAALIPHGASNRDGVLVARIIQDHYDALEGMFDFVGGTRELSTGYIKELHAALLRNQETYTVVDQFGRAFEKQLEKGRYKEAPNSPTRPDGEVHEYCPPEHVASEMDRLIALHKEHEARGIVPEVEAAWLHHRFTQIHPFSDGNGRVARAVATLVFIKSRWFPLIVKRDQWTQYIEALEKADHDDLRPLVAMFVEAQRDALIQATEVAYDVKPAESPHDAIIAVRDRLLQRGRLPDTAKAAAKQTAEHLFQIIRQRLGQIATELAAETVGGRDLSFSTSAGFPAPHEICASLVERTGHFAAYEVYSRGAVLTLNAGQPAALALTLYAVGPIFRGLIDVVAHLTVQSQPPVPIKGGTFQINYEETLEAAQARFVPWLDRVIVEGLMQWRRTL
jgi:fido (protein-threonine AMPylation protein)